MMLKELHILGQKDGLKSFEQVKDIYIHPELMTVESGLITPTMKSKVKAEGNTLLVSPKCPYSN